MRGILSIAAGALLSAGILGAAPALAGAVSSAYTDLDADRDCAVFAASGPDEGDWANMVCPGYKGYPVIVYYGDARESIFYGFPTAGEVAPVWESFDAFNYTGPKIEWRIDTDGDVSIPFATIHRWFVSDPEDPDAKVEVLVVEKVALIADRQGCVVGYVVATGNPDANDKARRIADTQARDFACGADQPAIDQGELPVPSFTRTAE